MKTEQKIELFRLALSRLASSHDIPEILSGEISENGNILSTKTSLLPKGQISLIVETLEFEGKLVLFDGPSQCFRLSACLSYTHRNGGSNGKHIDFLGSFRTLYGGGKVELTSLVLEGDFHQLYQEMNRTK